MGDNDAIKSYYIAVTVLLREFIWNLASGHKLFSPPKFHRCL